MEITIKLKETYYSNEAKVHEEEISSLKSSVARLTRDLEKNGSEHEVTVTDLKGEIDNLTDDHSAQGEVIKDLEEKVCSLTQKVRETEVDCQGKTEKCKDLTNQLDILKDQTERNQREERDKIKSLLQKNLTLSEEKVAIENQIKELNVNNYKVVANYKSTLESDEKVINQLISDNEELKDKVKIMMDEVLRHIVPGAVKETN